MCITIRMDALPFNISFYANNCIPKRTILRQ